MKGCEFADTPNAKNIAANLVMAWGRWNGAIGSLANKDYDSSSFEKSKIYTLEKMNEVRKKIEECHKLSKRSIDNFNETYYDNECSDEYNCECDDIDSNCGCDCSAYDFNSEPLYIIIGLLTTFTGVCLVIIISLIIFSVITIRKYSNVSTFVN